MPLGYLTAENAEIIETLFADVFSNEPWNDDWSDSEQLTSYISDLIGQSNSLTLGWFEENRLVALAMGHIRHWYSGTEYYIEEFCVDRQWQGKGIGSAFMDAIEAYLKKERIPHIFLLTERTVPAYSFYIHRGFRVLEQNAALVKRIEC